MLPSLCVVSLRSTWRRKDTEARLGVLCLAPQGSANNGKKATLNFHFLWLIYFFSF